MHHVHKDRDQRRGGFILDGQGRDLVPLERATAHETRCRKDTKRWRATLGEVIEPVCDERGTCLVNSTLVLQRLGRLNAKRPSRRDDACECTAQDRRQHEGRRVAENIEMHLR